MKTLITAHSGCDGTPDNSLEFISYALQCGADALEVDVRAAEDGTLYLSHDRTDAACPKLSQAFQMLRSSPMRINCDLKQPGLEEAVLALAASQGVAGQLLFSGDVSTERMRRDPEVRSRTLLNVRPILPTEGVSETERHLDGLIETCRVSWGSSFGTIAVYLTAPLCILWSGWRSMFFAASAICAAAAFVWLLYSGKAETCPARDHSRHEGPESPRTERLPAGMLALLLGIMAAIVCQGALRDGVTTWMPSFIAETYRLGNTVSILTGVVLPVFSIVCFQLALWLYDRKVQNELLLAGFIFFAGVLCAVCLRLTASYQAALSIALSAALTGCMHGVNLMLICMIPPHFAGYGNVSTISGLLNACTYIGSALSAWGAAFLAEHFGWNAVLTAWAAAALLGAALCLSLARRWESLRVK